MIVSRISSISCWLPRLASKRAVSTSPVVHGSMADDGRTFVLALRKDPFLVGVFIALGSLIGSVGYSIHGSRTDLGKLGTLKMDFPAIVSRAKRLLSGAGEATLESQELVPVQGVYGRVCTTAGTEPPVRLSSDPHRKSVFLFGPDAVQSILLQNSAYDILCSIGRDKDYLHHTMMEQQSTFWLVLFTRDASMGPEPLCIAPATWEGVIEHCRSTFPEALDDILTNLQALKEKKFEEFENDAGFLFLDAKKNRRGHGGPDSPPYFSYEYFCSLPKPRTAWEVRAFLFCELRLLKLFTGDGYTCNEGNSGRRVLEYLGPNTVLGELDETKCTVLKMNVQYSEVLARCHS